MCTDGVKQNVAARYNYSNGMAGLFLVARDEGTSALYRGLGPNVIRSVLMSALRSIFCAFSITLTLAL